MLSAIRVIAVDQQIAQGATTPVVETPGGGNSRIARTVTLQVTSEQSERIAVAERLGRLMLAVRSVETQEGEARLVVKPPEPVVEGTTPVAARANATVIFGSDVSSALARDEPSAMPRMRVIHGDTRSDVVFR